MRLAFLVFLALAACAAPDVVLDRTFDPCAPLALDVSGGDAAGIDAATAMWATRGVASFDGPAGPGAARLPVVFEEAAPAVHGYYDDEAGILYVNSRLVDPVARAITIAHELGHAFGLWHVAAAERSSVMNPRNQVAPTEADQGALEATWGGPCARPRERTAFTVRPPRP